MGKCQNRTRESHPLNPMAIRGQNGFWNEDTLPVMEWESAEYRVVLPLALQESMGIAQPVLRWSAEKRAAVLSRHARDVHIVQDISGYLGGWRFYGTESKSGYRRILFQDERGRWYAASIGELQGSYNMITVFGSRSPEFLRNRLKRLEDVVERRE